MSLRLTAVVLALPLAACAAPPPAAAPSAPPRLDRALAEHQIAAELDDLHDAAAHADEPRYFAHFASDAEYIGTDVTERWELAAFRAFAHPHFAKGTGWTYHSVRRAIVVDGSGRLAWFDEDLLGDRVGPTRGSGVLVLDRGNWRIEQYVLSFTVPNERFAAFRAAVDAPPAVDLKTRRDEAYRAATEAATRGDLARAGELLAALVPEAKGRPSDDLEFWLHNELTWVRWGAGDLAGARAEVEQARATLDHAILPEDARRSLRLHERWDRAYLALEAGLKAPASERARALADADRARADYEALARPAGDHDGLAVLAAFFAARRGEGRRAAEEAKKVDVAKDSDLQDLYVVSLALDAGGERARAGEVRARICAGHEYLMKPLLLKALEAEGHGCAKP